MTRWLYGIFGVDPVVTRAVVTRALGKGKAERKKLTHPGLLFTALLVAEQRYGEPRISYAEARLETWIRSHQLLAKLVPTPGGRALVRGLENQGIVVLTPRMKVVKQLEACSARSLRAVSRVAGAGKDDTRLYLTSIRMAALVALATSTNLILTARVIGTVWSDEHYVRERMD
jgi:hypothetical protein